VFGGRAVWLLAIYSHTINNMLYLPDYAIGHMIAFQVKAQMQKACNFGAEFERVARISSVAPDLRMIQATGKPVGPEALIEAASRALREL
jgi:Zn-dependent M32 family carboxypeptidase